MPSVPVAMVMPSEVPDFRVAGADESAARARPARTEAPVALPRRTEPEQAALCLGTTTRPPWHSGTSVVVGGLLTRIREGLEPRAQEKLRRSPADADLCPGVTFGLNATETDATHRRPSVADGADRRERSRTRSKSGRGKSQGEDGGTTRA